MWKKHLSNEVLLFFLLNYKVYSFNGLKVHNNIETFMHT